ncbi:MAG: ABC transporter ATP-binding protein [Endomicrobia bacterium]|nr:ABC transporter ATP-binding protein [Endomicrobiia bacterium]MCX7940940.1 ABC transporter ATP-binding protein [Endomicrobiia bacterium]MDW8055659.1 ABC transporter ATP-binding protein [Elusimicrobiota bacterium]
MNNNEIVVVRNVSKYFDGKQVLSNISFVVKKGEIFVLLGPNGAGKTTTVRILSGVLEPDSGEVYIFNKKMFLNNTELKRDIGYLPDEPYVYSKLRGIEFIEFILSLYKKEFDQGKYKYLISQFELQDVISQPIEIYSKGMKQKLLLMSILLRDPELYILDEPLVGLDPKCISFFKQYIKQISSLGKTVLLCTHLLELAEQLATRVCIINNGKILISGLRKEIASQLNLNTESLEEIYLRVTTGFQHE